MFRPGCGGAFGAEGNAVTPFTGTEANKEELSRRERRWTASIWPFNAAK
ncbi:hypothetical protein M8494_05235 [Serratia ureilytica]